MGISWTLRKLHTDRRLRPMDSTFGVRLLPSQSVGVDADRNIGPDVPSDFVQ